MKMRRRDLLLLPAAGSVLAQGKLDGTVMAPVKLEVYSDFQCPGCKQLHEGPLRQLREEFVAKGKVQLVHREFPLPMHKYAREAAHLATAAEKIGKYNVVSDALFRDQDLWSTTGRLEETVAKVLSPAELVKLKALAKDPKIAGEVEADRAAGTHYDLKQTPTMVFTRKGQSQPVSGAISYAILRRYVESLLTQ
jgi:protein-disulfide isomerase